QMRRQEAAAADCILGVRERIFLRKPNQDVPNDGPTYRECTRLIRALRPDVILTHWEEDKHRDHRTVARLTDEARWKAWDHVLADLGEPWYTPELYYYELHELFPHPSILVDITGTMERKLAAMAAMTSQLEVMARVVQCIKGLGAMRGFLRGTDHAEAFLGSNLMATLL
ncbi:MAG TPA: PIG-L family deacetylase, partial [Anaerolineae bacterium]|nr:PIG-L family deacetylase [Anaerolineae bacterium]